MVLGVRTYIRAAWEAPDHRHREWYIFKLREIYGQFVQEALPCTTPDSAEVHVQIHGETLPLQPTKTIKRSIRERYDAIRRSLVPGTMLSTNADMLDLRLTSTDAGEYQSQARYVGAWTHTWRQGPREPPPQTAFEQAAFHFHRVAKRAQCCNNSDCPAPYFFIVKKGQKYCTQKCAAAGEREAKRRWWHENKKRLRPRKK
jgi:hypothetical protein